MTDKIIINELDKECIECGDKMSNCDCWHIPYDDKFEVVFFE